MSTLHHKPLVSVVIPSYNHSKYIKEAILSILNQTYENIELIVIDDGSSDDSVKIIQKLANQYNFKFIHRENRGLLGTLNEGLSLSSGYYFAEIASDDIWLPEKIAQQVKAMKSDINLKISFHEVEEINQNGIVTGKVKYTNRENPIYDFENVLMYADLPPASIFMRKEELIEVGGYNDDLQVEDLYIWLKILRNGGYAKVINKTVSKYRIHDNNTHSNDLMITREHFRTVNMFLDKHKKFGKKVLNEWALRNANILARNHKKEALSYFKYLSLNSSFDIRLYKIIYKLMFR